MKHFLSILTAIFLFSSSVLVAQTTVSHSLISFKIKNLGIYAHGTLGGLQAKVVFNPADLAAAHIEAACDVSAITTDNSLRDDHIKSDEFLDLAHYPKISIKSISITHKTANKYTGKFNLTIKDKTLPVEIPFTVDQKGSLLIFNGSFTINRRDFGVGGNSLVLSDEIAISIEGEFQQ
jgi:polyisoprenoid-binding protein YceI